MTTREKGFKVLEDFEGYRTQLQRFEEMKASVAAGQARAKEIQRELKQVGAGNRQEASVQALLEGDSVPPEANAEGLHPKLKDIRFEIEARTEAAKVLKDRVKKERRAASKAMGLERLPAYLEILGRLETAVDELVAVSAEEVHFKQELNKDSGGEETWSSWYRPVISLNTSWSKGKLILIAAGIYIILKIVSMIPLLGWLITALFTLTAFGTIIQYLRERRQEHRQKVLRQDHPTEEVL